MQPTPPLQNQWAQWNQPAPDPQVNAQGEQANANAPLNVTAPYTGWYPRWWLLAAFCCSIIISLGQLLWQPVICSNDTLPLCSFVDRFSYLMILPMWLLFLAFWYGIFVVSVGHVEFPRRGRNTYGNFVRNISQFHSLSTLIIIQGFIAFVLLNVLWWINRTTPLAFAMLTIVAFVGHCCLFYRLAVDIRRLGFMIYGFVAVMLLVLEITLHPNFVGHWPSGDEWPLLLTEVLLLVVGVIALINTFRYRSTLAQTAIDAHNQSIDNSITWWAALRSVWPLSYLFPVRPVAHANQPDPQAQQNNQEL